jgi:tRNA-dihydrouridine synthase
LEIVRIAQTSGIKAVTIHPRTATQGFRGRADWSVIKRVKSAVSLPVIGNGDIETADDAMRMLAQTGCDGVMVGRAAIGNPHIFSEIVARLEGREVAPQTLASRLTTMMRYTEASVAYLGEETACYILRSRLCWFVKGMPHASHFRQAIRFLRSREEALTRIREFGDQLAADSRWGESMVEWPPGTVDPICASP